MKESVAELDLAWSETPEYQYCQYFVDRFNEYGRQWRELTPGNGQAGAMEPQDYFDNPIRGRAIWFARQRIGKPRQLYPQIEPSEYLALTGGAETRLDGYRERADILAAMNSAMVCAALFEMAEQPETAAGYLAESIQYHRNARALYREFGGGSPGDVSRNMLGHQKRWFHGLQKRI